MINEYYTPEKVKVVKEEFEKNNVVQLQQILIPEVYAKLLKVLLQKQFFHRKVPDEFSYATTESMQLVSEVCRALAPLVHTITGKKLGKKQIELYQHCDYTLRKDKHNRKRRTELILDLVTLEELWGGYTSIADAEGEVARFVPQANSLTIIELIEDQDMFVKYVNCLAERSRLLLRLW